MKRIPNYDYSQPGYYCTTVCVLYHKLCFGKIVEEQMHLNERGKIAESVWLSLPERFPHVRLDAFVCMPNHVHCIIELTEVAGQQMKPRAPSWEIMRTFKAVTTRFIRLLPGSPWFSWQPSVFESLLYNERRLHQARQYIYENPARWSQDKFYKPY